MTGYLGQDAVLAAQDLRDDAVLTVLLRTTSFVQARDCCAAHTVMIEASR